LRPGLAHIAEQHHPTQEESPAALWCTTIAIKIKLPLTITDEQTDRVLEMFKLCTEQVFTLSEEMKQAILQKMVDEAIPGR